MNKYLVLLLLLLPGAVNAQRTLQVHDPDFDSAYCMHEVLYGHIRNIDKPIHYSQFYSQHHRQLSEQGSLPPYYDSGFILQQTLTGNIHGTEKTKYYKILYQNNRHRITVRTIDSTANFIACDKLNYSYDDQELLTSKEVETNVFGNIVISYQYDTNNRISHIYETIWQKKQLTHCFIYTTSTTEEVLNEWKTWKNKAREKHFKLSHKLNCFSRPEKFKALLNDKNTLIIKQYDSLTQSRNYIITGPGTIFKLCVLPYSDTFYAASNILMRQYHFVDSKPIAYKGCNLSYNIGPGFYMQEAVTRRQKYWERERVTYARRLKKDPLDGRIPVIQ